MKKRSADYALEDLITDSENLLGNMGEVEALVAETRAEGAETIDDEISRRALESIEEAVELQINGYVELVISGDEMSAVADFYPPTGNMKPVDPDDIVPLMEAKGVTTGVDWDAIKEAIFKQRSSSCGCGQIYDGAFSGKLIKGDGVAAELLKKNGLKVITEEDL